MITLRESLNEYLEMRRGLGYKLSRACSELMQFIQFMEDQRATHIDTDLSLEWTQLTRKFNRLCGQLDSALCAVSQNIGQQSITLVKFRPY